LTLSRIAAPHEIGIDAGIGAIRGVILARNVDKKTGHRAVPWLFQHDVVSTIARSDFHRVWAGFSFVGEQHRAT
jgi:hypothetical protein